MDPLEFHHILALLAGTVAVSALFRYLRLPQVLSYLVAGVVLGPWALSVIPIAPATRYLAEFGLVFLMLTVGLEFSLAQLVAMRRAVPGFGGAQVLISCVLFAALAPLYLWELSRGLDLRLTPGIAAGILYLGLFPSVLAYIFWNRAVAAVGATKAGLFIYLMPVFGVLLSVIFLKESLHLFHFVDILEVATGIYLTTTAGARG